MIDLDALERETHPHDEALHALIRVARFVLAFAELRPIEPYDGYNACRYCGAMWAGDDFREALAGRNPHDSDCPWVVANRIIREERLAPE